MTLIMWYFVRTRTEKSSASMLLRGGVWLDNESGIAVSLSNVDISAALEVRQHKYAITVVLIMMGSALPRPHRREYVKVQLKCLFLVEVQLKCSVLMLPIA